MKKKICLVVLGSKNKNMLTSRAVFASKIYRKYQYLIISGGRTTPFQHSEAVKARKIMNIVDRENVYIEDRSHSTLENLVLVGKIIEKLGIKRVDIVSSSPHGRRICKIISGLSSWDGVKVTILNDDSTPSFGFLVGEFLLYLYSFLDPNEVFIAKYAKILFRNESNL